MLKPIFNQSKGKSPFLLLLIRFWILSVCAGLVLQLGIEAPLAAQKPESPEVQAMLSKAAGYLEKSTERDSNFGGNALVTYALLKFARMKAKDSKGSARCQAMTKKVIDEIRAALKQDKKRPGGPWERMYSPCIALMFLCELDSEKYAPEIKEILQFVYDRQRADGSFGYLSGNETAYGDTSQVQYAALAYWYANQKGFSVPPARGQAILNWLIKTQNGDGGFVYHAGKGEPPTVTMCSAGMSALYITGDWLGISDAAKDGRKKRQGQNGLPATVTPVQEGEEVNLDRPETKINLAGLDQCKAKGNTWYSRNHNYNERSQKGWILYYMYGIERYRAFWAKSQGIDEAEPDWYTTGVKYLKEKQADDGGFRAPIAYPNRSISTAFAMLFLMRNSRATIKEYEEGSLFGGEGIENGDLKTIGGKIVAGEATRDVEDLMTLANSAEDTDWAAFEKSLSGLRLSEDPQKRAQQLSDLRYLVKHKQYEARIIAVTQLGKLRDFESVPNMIYALGDPDEYVRNAAHKALRLLSRRFEEPDIPENADDQYFNRLKRRWKQWYLTIQPDAVFLD